MPTKDQQDVRGKIYNDSMRREEAPTPAPEPIEEERPTMREERPEPIVTAQPNRRIDNGAITPPVVEAEEDDTWGAIPSFLRRHKK